MGTSKLNDYDLGILCLYGIGSAFKKLSFTKGIDSETIHSLLDSMTHMYTEICTYTTNLVEINDYQACTFHAATGQHAISLYESEDDLEEEHYKEPKRGTQEELMSYCKRAAKEDYELKSLISGFGALCRSSLEDIEIGMFFFGIIKKHLGFKKMEPSASFMASKLAREYIEIFN